MENITDNQAIKPREDPTSTPKFTKPTQDPAPAPMFTKPSKVPTPAPTFTRQNKQQFTNNNPISPQRVQKYRPPQRVEKDIAPQRVKQDNLQKNYKNNKQTKDNPHQTRYDLRSNSNLPTHPQHALQHLHTQPIFQNNKALHIYNVNGGKQTVGSLMKGETSKK